MLAFYLYKLNLKNAKLWFQIVVCGNPLVMILLKAIYNFLTGG